MQKKQSFSKNKTQVSSQLNRIGSACKKVAGNSLRCSNRTFLGNSQNTNFDPINHRRMQADSQNLTQSKEFEPYNSSFFTASNAVSRSKIMDMSQMLNSSQKRDSFIYGNSEGSKEINFLRYLYQKKTQDLNTIKNVKHQKIFIQRLKDKLNDTQFVAVDCEFGRGCIRQICNYLNFSNISKLVLNKNPIGDDGIRYLNMTLPKLQIQDLSLVSVNLTPKGCKSLIEVLTQSQTIQKIDLSSFQGLNRNRLGKQSASALQAMLKNPKSKIQFLSVENSYLSEDGLISLCNGLYRDKNDPNLSCLKELNIAKNDIKEHSMKMFVDKLKNVRLVYLNISNNLINDGGLDLISEVIGTQYSKNLLSLSLRSLNISNNNIRSFGVEIFSKEVVNNQILEEVNFNDNPLFEGQRFFNFKFFLCRNWAVKTLHLENTLGGVDDCRSLMEGLEGNRSVESLNMSRNSLDSQSFLAIGIMLSKNKSLKKLIADTCNIADFYVGKMEHFKNGCLTDISLDNNFINDKGAKTLLKLLRDNPKIHRMSLKKNCLSVKMTKQIQTALRDNKIICERDEPDLSYFDYVEEMQNSQKLVLMSSISRLKKQQEKQKISHLISEIVEKQIEISQKKQQISQQEKIITSLAKQIQVRSNSPKSKEQQFFFTNNSQAPELIDVEAE